MKKSHKYTIKITNGEGENKMEVASCPCGCVRVSFPNRRHPSRSYLVGGKQSYLSTNCTREVFIKSSTPPKPNYKDFIPEVLNTSSIKEGERLIDSYRDNYKRAMNRWWMSLTPKQKKESWDSQLIFYISGEEVEKYTPKKKK